MNTKVLLAAALLTGTAIGMSVPAQALTGNQYASQGEGVYTTSKGVPDYYHRHRGYYPAYQYRRVYRPSVYVQPEQDEYDPDPDD